jgi:hypothetical protein
MFITDSGSRIQGQKDPVSWIRIRIKIKEFQFFNPKNCTVSKLSEIYYGYTPNSGSRGQIAQKNTGSRIRNTGRNIIFFLIFHHLLMVQESNLVNKKKLKLNLPLSYLKRTYFQVRLLSSTIPLKNENHVRLNNIILKS